MVVNIYDAETELSKLLAKVQAGESVTIAKAGKPVADLVPHQPQKTQLKFGVLSGKLQFNEGDFVGLDKDVQEMFDES